MCVVKALFIFWHFSRLFVYLRFVAGEPIRGRALSKRLLFKAVCFVLVSLSDVNYY